MSKTVYITGTGRSGTNVLKSLLTLDKNVASLPFEQRYTVDPDGIFDFYRSLDSWSPFVADKRIDRLESFLLSLAEKPKANEVSKESTPYFDWELEKWIPRYRSFVERLIASLTSFSYEGRYPGKPTLQKLRYLKRSDKNIADSLIHFLENCTASILDNQNGQIYVEDNTWTCLYAKEAIRLAEDAHILYMMRDPRDVISSMMVQRWTPSELDHLIIYYKDLIAQWEDEKRGIDVSTYSEIRFEDLIADRQNQLDRISKETGVAVSPAMMNFDLSKSNIGRYKQSFDAKEIERLDAELDDILKKYNYS